MTTADAPVSRLSHGTKAAAVRSVLGFGLLLMLATLLAAEVAVRLLVWYLIPGATLYLGITASIAVVRIERDLADGTDAAPE